MSVSMAFSMRERCRSSSCSSTFSRAEEGGRSMVEEGRCSSSRLVVEGVVGMVEPSGGRWLVGFN